MGLGCRAAAEIPDDVPGRSAADNLGGHPAGQWANQQGHGGPAVADRRRLRSLRPPPRNIAFGAGPHFCPGAALTQVWLASALAEFFQRFPGAHLAGSLDWQPGTLSVPGR
jgi:hypothetical protein